MTTTIQGRHLTPTDIHWIQTLIAANPNWHRTRLSREICTAWKWFNSKGQIKDMACRTMLIKLESLGYFRLPAPHNSGGGNSYKNLAPVIHSTAAINCQLRDLTPLHVEVVQDTETLKLFKHLLEKYHYLGFQGSVGENMKYLVYDFDHQPLACLLFGSAAWKVASRDQWIGWDANIRNQRRYLIASNMRFLILPWVKVPHLASHLLGHIARRISSDWMAKYGHPLHMLETFVEQERFRGVSYQAANWLRVGQTQGRSRNDTKRLLQVPIKDVYLYPLIRHVREVLSYES